MKRATEDGIRVSACSRSPSLTRSSSSAKPKPRLATNGKGCAGSIASGVSTGNTSAMNRSSSQARSPGSRSVGSITDTPASASSRRSASQVTCWSAISLPVRWRIASSCCAGVSPSWLERLDAGEKLAFEPGDPHHVELVEIVRRDRQKAQPLEQRMARIVGLGEHPLVEGEPGQLAIDEAGRRNVGRRGWISTGCALVLTPVSPSRSNDDI